MEYKNKDNKLFFWRIRSGSEIDFILYGPNVFLAIEVKNTKTVRPDDLKQLKAFKQDYPESEGILLYRGEERLKRDGILIMPCQEFLESFELSQNFDKI